MDDIEIIDASVEQEEENEEFEDEDEGELNLNSFKNTSSFTLDLNVDTLTLIFNQNQFNFDPDFQRRTVWDNKRKSKFIESMMLNLPIPSLLLAKNDERNEYIIIDGKQRLSAIMDFVCPAKDGSGFKLTGLEVLKELNGYTFRKLKAEPQMISYLSRFTSYPIRANIVRNYDNRKLYFIFARLNSGSVPLSTQELRHTLYPGEFSKFINQVSKENVFIKRMLNLKGNKVDLRMRDAELLCRYYSFKYFLSNYDNTVGALLDHTYKTINENWKNQYESMVLADYEEFNKSAEFIYDTFKDDAFRKYSAEKESSKSFNRLVYDILIVHFSIPEHRKKVMERKTEFVNFFINLFSIEEYMYSFLPTTSDREKTMKRFYYFRKAFDERF